MVAITKTKTPKRSRKTKPTNTKAKVEKTATANDATKPGTKGKAKAKPSTNGEPSPRAKLFDTSPCAVIRTLRALSWDFAKVRKAFDGVGFAGVSDTTIRCQLAPTRKGEPAELSKDQIKQLETAAK